ncbi:MAG: flagellar protein FlaF [Rhodospirillaceae bacterium]|jgi:flagellar biosynthesis activator protein FlaF|nr:flagellar protein FlaF [Rhodospirillaceae bacterium]
MTAPAHIYARNEAASVTGRVAEGRAFVKAARLLDDLRGRPADTGLRDEAIAFNRVLWTAVQADVTDKQSPLPVHLKAGLLSLSLYADRALTALRTSRDVAALEALIAVNRDVAGALLATP